MAIEKSGVVPAVALTGVVEELDTAWVSSPV
jgi:hypothetical protein